MEEKLLILKMLEEGKIKSEEAVKLLEALEKSKVSQNRFVNKDASSIKLNDTINEISKKAERFAEKFGPDFISKVENVSNDFADAAVRFADKMVSYLNNGIKNIEKYNVITKKFTIPVTNDDMKICFKTQNLRISINGSDNKEVSIKLVLNLYDEEINVDDYIQLTNDNESISFVSKFPINIYGELEVSVPKNIKELITETTNAKCLFVDIHAALMNVATTNGKIEIDKCILSNLTSKTNNGKTSVNKTTAGSARVETSNAGIEVTDSSFDDLKVFTSNNYINFNNVHSIDSAEALYEAQTTNGRIIIALFENEGTAYKINAKTSLGNINLSNIDSSFTIEINDNNMQSEAIITADNYEEKEKRILINATTTNSSINISKE